MTGEGLLSRALATKKPLTHQTLLGYLPSLRKSGARAQQRPPRFLTQQHYSAAKDAIASATVITFATGRSPSIAASCTVSPNAAQPSLITVQWNSRTCASRTVDATPPLVTMPVK